MRRFGYLMSQVMLIIVLLVLVFNLMNGRPLTDSLLFALALLISVILRRVRVLFPCLVLKRRHFFPWLYPETRAPPHRSAFSAF